VRWSFVFVLNCLVLYFHVYFGLFCELINVIQNLQLQVTSSSRLHTAHNTIKSIDPEYTAYLDSCQ
jgi:hypothetical protein